MTSNLKSISQVGFIRDLVEKHGKSPGIVCRLYAQAERDGLVMRKSNLHDKTPEQYAKALYRNTFLRRK